MSKKMRFLLTGFVLAVIVLICAERFLTGGRSEAVQKALISPTEDTQSKLTEQKVQEESKENLPHDGQLVREINPNYEKQVLSDIPSEDRFLSSDASPVHSQSALNEKIASLDPAVFESENLKKQIALPDSGARHFQLPEHSNFNAAGRTDWVAVEVK